MFVPPVAANRLSEELNNRQFVFDINDDNSIDFLWEKILHEQIVPSKSILLNKNPFITLVDADLGQSKSPSQNSLQKISKVIYSIENDQEKVRVHIRYSRELDSFVSKCSAGFQLRIKYGEKPRIDWDLESEQSECEIEKIRKCRLLAVFLAYGYLTKTEIEEKV